MDHFLFFFFFFRHHIDFDLFILLQSAVHGTQSYGATGEADDFAARKAAAGGSDRGATATVEMPVAAPSKN